MIEDQFLDMAEPIWADVGAQPALCELRVMFTTP